MTHSAHLESQENRPGHLVYRFVCTCGATQPWDGQGQAWTSMQQHLKKVRP